MNEKVNRKTLTRLNDSVSKTREKGNFLNIYKKMKYYFKYNYEIIQNIYTNKQKCFH